MFSFLKRHHPSPARVLVIGDIHGMSGRFFSLMEQVQFDASRSF